MKTTATLHCLAATLAASITLHAETLTVDNRPNAVAMFSNLQAAIDAAQPNDTIQIAGGASSYNGSVYKPLHFRGPGYFLSENNVEGINNQEAVVSLDFHHDSTKGDASGSTVKYLDSSYIRGFSKDGLVSFSVSYCSGNISGTLTAPNFIPVRLNAKSCYVEGRLEHLAAGSSITDSIIASAHLEPNTIVDRCIFRNIGDTYSKELSSISDSIFIASSSATVANFLNNHEGTVSHCMAVGGTYLPAGNGNINQEFAFDVFQQGSSPDGYFKLKAGSPAVGAGRNGGDLGAFGGVNPYRLSGLPSIPRITNLAIDAVATDANGLTFNVDAVAVGTTSE